MNKFVFSANKITSVDLTKCPFDPVKYSKFKFGSKRVARTFGRQLAESFWESFKNLECNQQIVVFPSPYNFIPTATFVLKDYFIRYFNDFLIDNGRLPVEEGKIVRNTTYREDYGALSGEDRMKLIGNDKFHIDREFVQGKTLIFIDDIRVTGSHERMIDKLATECELTNQCHFIYFASVENSEIPAQIENELNYSYVNSLLDINRIIHDEEFIFNTRTVKYILNSNSDECKEFLNYQSGKILSNMYHLAIGNSYHLIDEYKTNFKLLREIVNKYNL